MKKYYRYPITENTKSNEKFLKYNTDKLSYVEKFHVPKLRSMYLQ